MAAAAARPAGDKAAAAGGRESCVSESRRQRQCLLLLPFACLESRGNTANFESEVAKLTQSINDNRQEDKGLGLREGSKVAYIDSERPKVISVVKTSEAVLTVVVISPFADSCSKRTVELVEAATARSGFESKKIPRSTSGGRRSLLTSTRSGELSRCSGPSPSG